MRFKMNLLNILVPVIYIPMVLGTRCPQPSVVKDFDVKAFMGTWYQQASKGTLLFQGPGSCVKAEYTLDEKTNTVTVHNSQKIAFWHQNVDGTAVLSNPASGEGSLSVTLNTIAGKQTANLLVLATDYKNFAILYSCKGIKPFASSWILTRKQKLEGDEKAAIDKMIDDAFDQITKNKDMPKRSDFAETSQSDC